MPESRYLSVLLDTEMLEQIEDYRFTNRLPSRTEAIRELIRIGLQQVVVTPKPSQS